MATNELAPNGIAGPDQTFTTLTAEQAACPNEQMRGGFSGRLPDCRAYELVTPPVKNSAQFDAGLRMAYASKAAADGEALTLTTAEPRPGAPTAGEEYVATRGAGGWIAEDIMPLESYDGVGCAEYQRRVRVLGSAHQGRDRRLAEGHALPRPKTPRKTRNRATPKAVRS